MLNPMPVVIEPFQLTIGDGSVATRYAKLSVCTDYVVSIDQNRKVHDSRLSTGESWIVPVVGNAEAVALNNNYEFAVASDDGTIQRFDMTMPHMCVNKILSGRARALAYNPQSNMLVAGLEDGFANLYDLTSKAHPELIGSQKLSECAVRLIALRKETVVGVNIRGQVCALRNVDSEPKATTYGQDLPEFDSWAMGHHEYLSSFLVGGAGSYIRHYAQYNLKPTFLPTSFTYVRELIYLDFVDDFCTRFAVVGPDGVEIWNAVTMTCESFWSSEGRPVLCARANSNRLKVILG